MAKHSCKSLMVACSFAVAAATLHTNKCDTAPDFASCVGHEEEVSESLIGTMDDHQASDMKLTLLQSRLARFTTSGTCNAYGCADVFIRSRSCQCNKACVQFNSCCPDYKSECMSNCETFGCSDVFVESRSCQCNKACAKHNSCCSDYEARCTEDISDPGHGKATNDESVASSCEAYGCIDVFVESRSCQCNKACAKYNSCCSDYEARCTKDIQAPSHGEATSNDASSTNSCEAYGCIDMFVESRSCQCNKECAKHNSCCSDYEAKCTKDIPDPGDGEAASNDASAANSCKAFGCADTFVPSRSCQCNKACATHNSCCSDYAATCGDGGADHDVIAPSLNASGEETVNTHGLLKVMSYNVWFDSFDIDWGANTCKFVKHCYRNDLCSQHDEIRKWRPDVVGTQELGPDYCADMLSAKVGPSMKKAEGGESLLYDSRTVELIPNTKGHEELRYCDMYACRAFGWAKYRMQGTEFVFWHFNVHMTHEFCAGPVADRCTTHVRAVDGQGRNCTVNECHGECKCNKEGFQGMIAKRMLEKYEDMSPCGEPVLMTGDWNPHKDMLAGRMPWDGGVNAAEEVLVQKGFKLLEKPGPQQDNDICKYCDRVFYTAANFDVVEDATGKRSGSDHTPHIVTLKPIREVKCTALDT